MHNARVAISIAEDHLFETAQRFETDAEIHEGLSEAMNSLEQADEIIRGAFEVLATRKDQEVGR